MGLVDHVVGDLEEEGAEDGFGLRGELGDHEGVLHDQEPAVAGGGGDGERGVAHAEGGVASLFDVARRTAEAADEKISEANFGAGEVVSGIHGAEEVVGGDLGVEGGDEAGEAVFADEGVELLFVKIHTSCWR